jgi:Tfp pilus assembly protein PilX
MKLKRLEEAADSAIKIEQKAAAGLVQAEKGYKGAMARVSAAEAALRRARRQLKQAKKAAKSAQKDARKVSKKVAKARKKAKRKAQLPASPSAARKTMAAKKSPAQVRSSRAAATGVHRSVEPPEIEQSLAATPIVPLEPGDVTAR